jgi:CheY-like chemotaxis protein
MTGTLHPVLVVEDDEDIREGLLDLLADSGYQSVGARDGREALQKLTQIQPCLILLDLMMPVMDGRAFRAEQLRDPSLAKIPVVVISAYHDVGEQARDMNAAKLLRKPVDAEELLRTVAEHC